MIYSNKDVDTKRKIMPRKTVYKSRRRIKRSIRLLFGSIVIIVAFGWLCSADFLSIHEIEIKKSDYINPSEVKELFGLESYLGMNIFWFPYKEIRSMLVSHPEISSAKITPFPLGKLSITLVHEEPDMLMIRPWGYYVLDKNGRFIETLPPFFEPYNVPIKFSDESILFDDFGNAISEPWKAVLSKEKVDDRELMLALGFKDLLTLREFVKSQPGIPEVQYVGYHERYGLMLKCEKKPLILLGYGNNLMIHYTRALKVLADTSLPFGEDKYIDIRFDEYQCVNDIAKLEGFARLQNGVSDN